MHRYDVSIALDHEDAVFLDNGLLGLIDAVELAFLVIDIGVGRVDILLRDTLRS